MDNKAGQAPPTPITSKKDVKKPDRPAPVPAEKTTAPKEKEPKKIMGGTKKEGKQPEPPVAEEKPSESIKEIGEPLKLASESGEKHVEIERLELVDAPEQPAQAPPAEPSQ